MILSPSQVSLALGFVMALMGLGSSAYAGGPLSVAPDGTPSAWNGTVTLNPEAGGCGTSHSHDTLVSRVNEYATRWADVTGADFVMHVVDGSIPVDVTSSNYKNYWVSSSGDPGLSDGINPVIFDEDGSIVTDLFKSSTAKYTILGAATPSGYEDSTFHTITDGEFVINCRCQAGSGFDCDGTFTDAALNFTLLHETGHLINLDHTQVNQAIADTIPSSSALAMLGFSSGDEYCAANPSVNCDAIPSMYAVAKAPTYQQTLSRDDEVAFLNLYGSSLYTSTTFSVSGSLTDASGNPLRCADIQATTDNPADTISVISGALAPAQNLNAAQEIAAGESTDTADAGECLSHCGDFVLKGLDPNKTYTITVKPIDSLWAAHAGSTIGPCNQNLNSITTKIIGENVNSSGGQIIAMGTIPTSSAGGGGGNGTAGSGSSGGSGGGLETVNGIAQHGCSLIPSSQGSSSPYFFFLAPALLFLCRKQMKSLQ
jgi:hypothetical protein